MKYVITHVQYNFVRDNFIVDAIDDDIKNIIQFADYILTHSTFKSYVHPVRYEIKIDINTCARIISYGENEGKLRLSGRMLFYTSQDDSDFEYVDFDMISVETVIPTKYIWK